MLILLGCIAISLLGLYLLYWSDLIFYWSDPVKCPPTEFPFHYDRSKYDEIFSDAPFEKTGMFSNYNQLININIFS